MTSTAIVTGAAGFIGSHLCEKLIKVGYNVVGIDDFSSGKKANLEPILSQMTLVSGSILDPTVLEKACKHSPNPVALFHLAAIPSVPRSIEIPDDSHNVNINGTYNIFRAAQKFGIGRVIYSASSSAYGQQTGEFKSENLPPDLISPYGLQKWVGERYASLFNEFFGVECISLRYFNVFGPRQDPNSFYSAVIPKFIKFMIEEKPIEIHGDGLQTRDFTYVENILEANLKALAAPKICCGKVYNIAMGESVSLLKLLDYLEQILNKKAKREFHSPRIGDIKHSKASIELARQDLGFNPIISTYEGLSRTVASYL